MALPAIKEKRLSERFRLSGLLPGRLTIENIKHNFICRPVDVSEHGLGIVIQAKVQEGAKALLECTVGGEKKVVDLKIAWAKPDFGKQDLYRVGLVCIDQNVDLEEVFLATGCLKKY